MKVNHDEISVAVIGAGYWGRNLIRNFFELGSLRAICDSDEEAILKLGSDYKGVKTYSSAEKILEDPSIRAVSIATPAGNHASMVRDALLAGKDVLVEKPLALSLEEGKELVELSSRLGRILMVGHLLWYHPALLKLKELVDNGELGRLQYVYSHRLNLGRFRQEENILWSFAPHDISAILGLVDEEPNQYLVQGGYYLHNQIADVTVSTLSFPSGVNAHIFVSWLHPFKEQRLVVVGSQKMAVFNDLEGKNKLHLYSHTVEWRDNVPVPNQKDAVPVEVEGDEPLRLECEHFLECVATRSVPRTDGKEGLRVLAVLRKYQEALEMARNSDSEVSGPTFKSHSEFSDSVFVHSTATVDQGVEILEGTKIWHYSHVMRGARIGKNCSLGQNVFVGPGVVVGDKVKVQNNVSLYEGVELEDEVFCGPSMVFTNVINPRSGISRKDEFRPTLVKKGATLGANCTIICGNEIGRCAFVGAGAVVTKDVPDFGLFLGNPGRLVGWMCRCGVRLDLSPDDGKGDTHAECKACGARYRREGDRVMEISQG